MSEITIRQPQVVFPELLKILFEEIGTNGLEVVAEQISLLAIANDLTILPICFELPSVIVRPTPALALRSAKADDPLRTLS